MKRQRPAIPIARPVLDERELAAVRRPLESGWVAQGPEVEAFEREFALAVGAEHACAVSSCTAALHLALRAVGVGAGDEVVTVSHSFIATANSVRFLGATPVFVDVRPATFNMDPERLAAALTPKTRAVLCVHQMGMPCDLAAILEVAASRGLPVVEDAACAVGSEILTSGAWRRLGRPHGDVACFSFHPRKVLTTGDGGMLTTADAELDRKFRLWRQHAMSVPAADRHGAAGVAFESHLELGYNYRLTDIQAAIGRVQLERLDELVARRRELAARYRSLLGELPGPAPGVTPPEEPAWARSNWQSYCVRLPPGADQRRTMQAMLELGISTRRGVTCAHREPAFAAGGWSCGEGPGPCGCPAASCRRLAESEAAQDGSIILPLFHQMTEEDQVRTVEALARALPRAPA